MIFPLTIPLSQPDGTLGTPHGTVGTGHETLSQSTGQPWDNRPMTVARSKVKQGLATLLSLPLSQPCGTLGTPHGTVGTGRETLSQSTGQPWDNPRLDGFNGAGLGFSRRFGWKPQRTGELCGGSPSRSPLAVLTWMLVTNPCVCLGGIRPHYSISSCEVGHCSLRSQSPPKPRVTGNSPDGKAHFQEKGSASLHLPIENCALPFCSKKGHIFCLFSGHRIAKKGLFLRVFAGSSASSCCSAGKASYANACFAHQISVN